MVSAEISQKLSDIAPLISRMLYSYNGKFSCYFFQLFIFKDLAAVALWVDNNGDKSSSSGSVLTNYAIHWIVIYRVDSVFRPKDSWALV